MWYFSGPTSVLPDMSGQSDAIGKDSTNFDKIVCGR